MSICQLSKRKMVSSTGKYVLCYVGDVFCISENPMDTMKGIQSKFKFKYDKMDKPGVYLGVDLSTMDIEQVGK